MNTSSIITIAIILSTISILYYVYMRVFKSNYIKALNDEPIFKLPDLHDLAVGVIVIVILAAMTVMQKNSYESAKVTGRVCTSDQRLEVKGISKNYDLCRNDFGYVVFRDQDTALQLMMDSKKDFLEKTYLNTKYRLDKDYLEYYYGMTNNLYESDPELILLLEIYDNYYLREFSFKYKEPNVLEEAS